jgi:hypothetical protein
MPGDAEELKAAADQLAEATLALEKIDYNVPLEEDLQAILGVKEDLREICLRYRREQHAQERESDD